MPEITPPNASGSPSIARPWACGADVSLRTIAKEADVGVATASRHFPDRDGLHRAVIEPKERVEPTA